MSHFKLKGFESSISTAKIAGLFFAYTVLGFTTLWVNPMQGSATLLWPPAGIALAAIILWGSEIWPAIFLGSIVINIYGGASGLVAISIALACTYGAIGGAFILKRFGRFNEDIDRLRDVIWLVSVALVTTGVVALIGVSSLWSGGIIPESEFLRTFEAWWVGDFLGVIVFAPLLLCWSRFSWKKVSTVQRLEAVVLIILVVIVNFFVSGSFAVDSIFGSRPLPFVLFPFFVWGALRFGQIGNAVITFVTAVFIGWGTVRGLGPFMMGTMHVNLIVLDIFLSVIGISGMTLASVISEKESHQIALKNSQALKSNILESSLDCIVTINHRGEILEFNSAAEHTFGFNAKEVVGKNVAEVLIPEKLRQRFKSGLIRYLLTNEARILNSRIECVALKRDGTEFPVELTVTRISDQDLPLFSGFIRDISDRKLAEERLKKVHEELETKVQERTLDLKKSTTMLEDAQQLAQIGSWEWDIMSNRVKWSKALYEIFGLDFDGFSPTLHGYLDKVPSENRDYVHSVLRKSYSSREEFKMDHPIIKKGGGIRMLHCRGQLVKDAGGKPVKMYGMCQDITERQTILSQLDEAKRGLEVRVNERTVDLGKANERLRILAETGKLLSVSADIESTLKAVASFAVPSFAEWCAVDLLIDGSIKNVAISHVTPEMEALTIEVMKYYAERRNDRYGVHRVFKTGQSELYAEGLGDFLASLTTDANQLSSIQRLNINSIIVVPMSIHGQTIGAMTFISTGPQRIYEQSDLELAQELAKRAALAVDNVRLFRKSQKAIKTRDEFMSIASHELKTPLTALMLQLQMTRRNNKIESLDEAFALSLRQVDSLAHLTDELLDVSRVQSGQFVLNIDKINLSFVIKETVNRLVPQLNNVGCSVEIDIDEGIEAYLDYRRIEQVMVNLISNIIKYAPKGPARISLKKKSDRAEIIVEDKGPGIVTEKQEKIFECFERANSDNNISGLGLGLFITKQIVNAHHGEMSVKSTLGLGSRFTIDLPL